LEQAHSNSPNGKKASISGWIKMRATGKKAGLISIE